MTARRLPLGGLLVIGAVAVYATPCLADETKEACIDANANAQDLRRDHRLAAARAMLVTCSDPSCPGLVRNDCQKRLAELDQAQPSVVFDVTESSGAFVSSVKVSVDGKPSTDARRGTMLALDPGAHTVTFEGPGLIPLTRTVVMIEGDKGHHERIVLSPVATDHAADATQPGDESGWRSSQKLIGIVAAGTGLAGLALGGIFGAMTISEKSAQNAACSPACSGSSYAQAVSDHESGITDSTVSTVGFIAGAALVAAGAYLFFTAPTKPTQGGTAALELVPSVGLAPGAGSVLLSGRF